MRRINLWTFGTLIALVEVGCSTGAPVTTSPSDAASVSLQTAAPSSSGAPATVLRQSGAIACDEESVGCAGKLTAGVHRTAQFDHPFAFEVPEGWTNGRDVYRAYTLTMSAEPTAEFIVWSHAAPAKQTPDCGPARREGFGTSVPEWLRSLSTDDRLDVTPAETFMLGNHAATRVEVSARSTFKAMCPFNSDPFAVIVTDTETPPTRHHGGAGSMTFVDFGNDAVVIWNDAGDGTRADVLERFQPVILSIRFDN